MIEAYMAVACSTGHLQFSDVAALNTLATEPLTLIAPRETGWFVKIPADGVPANWALHISQPTMRLLCDAHAHGFRMVEFDRDADTLDNYPTFDW